MEHQDLVDKNEESVQSIEKVSNTEDRDNMNEVEGVKSELINGFEAEIKVNTNAQEYSCLKTNLLNILIDYLGTILRCHYYLCDCCLMV
ncbi:hypothetical protein AHAS_Ahas11G0075600 [Arachis hypogaea]